MSFLRNLWTDLVEKRLWPVAVVLLLALVAVPFVIGGSEDPVEAPLPGAAAAGATGAADAQVALTPGAPVRLDREGKQRNPFRQQHVPKVAAATGTSSPAGSTLPAPTPAMSKLTLPGTGGATLSVPTTTVPGTAKAPSASPSRPTSKPGVAREAFTISLTINQLGREPVRREIGRLTPLPSAVTPYLVYLGVLQDRRTAVFLVSSDVIGAGDGTCRPKPGDCQTVELKAGQRETFDVQADDGSIARRYELRLTRVARDGVSAEAQAASAASRAQTRAGAELVKTSVGNDQYLMDTRTGLLRRTSTRFRDAELSAARSRARAVKALDLAP